MRECAVCGRSEWTPVQDVGQYTIIRCESCGLQCTDPMPSAEAADEIYSEDYFTGASEHGVNYMTGSEVERYDRKRFQSVLRELEKAGASSGRLLDVGCATGNFLVAAREAGFEVEGSEFSEAAVSFAHHAHGLCVYGGLLGDAGLDPESYDVITLNHVLEHVPEPVEFLRDDVAPLLKSNGLLYIEVPNIESIQARVDGAHWEHLRPQQHLYHFAPDTLGKLVADAGYRDVCITTLPEQEIRIRGALVYLGISTPSEGENAEEGAPVEQGAAAEKHNPAHVMPDDQGDSRQMLRRMARLISTPAARYQAARGREMRLVATARPPIR